MAVFKNANEPIIDREVFDRVQEITAKTKRRAPKKENGERSIFNGLIYCGDCHSKMRYHTNTVNKDIHYFTCSDNKVDYRGNCPGRDYVSADSLEKVVRSELRQMAHFLLCDEQYFAELLIKKNEATLANEQRANEEALHKAELRLETVIRLYEKLYEDNAIGKVSDEWFSELSHKYEVERLELKSKIHTLKTTMSDSHRQKTECEKFIQTIRQFMQMQKLTALCLENLLTILMCLKQRLQAKTELNE